MQFECCTWNKNHAFETRATVAHLSSSSKASSTPTDAGSGRGLWASIMQARWCWLRSTQPTVVASW